MPSSDPAVTSRRAFLRGALAMVGLGLVAPAALTGCDLFGSTPDAADQDHGLDGFLAGTVALGHLYDVTITALPDFAAQLTPLRDAHRAHAQALADALATPVPIAADSAAPPTSPEAAMPALTAAEKSGRDAATAACIAASARLAPLLGSIAAARASHLEVLV